MFVLCDLNKFYASIIRMFKPELKDVPIMVLSNNDQCNQTSGFHHGEVRGIITCLCDGLLDYLEDGYEIEIDGLGHFSISLTSRPVENKKDIRAESVNFGKLNFRANKKVRNRLSGIEVSRVAHSVQKSAESERSEWAEILRNFLSEYPCATRADYARITGVLKSKAVKDLNEFIRQGWLRRSGRTVVYLMGRE